MTGIARIVLVSLTVGALVAAAGDPVWAGGGMPVTASRRVARDSIAGDTQRLLDEYEVLKIQSLTLIETVKALQHERDQLLDEVKTLTRERQVSQALAHEVKALSEALERSRQALATLRRAHGAALARAEQLEQANLQAMRREIERPAGVDEGRDD